LGAQEGFAAFLSDQTGLNQQELLNRLSQMLPQTVDELTPNGQVPAKP
jgi:uncharacterized protein YidB (DUF937 family)